MTAFNATREKIGQYLETQRDIFIAISGEVKNRRENASAAGLEMVNQQQELLICCIYFGGGLGPASNVGELAGRKIITGYPLAEALLKEDYADYLPKNSSGRHNILLPPDIKSGAFPCWFSNSALPRAIGVEAIAVAAGEDKRAYLFPMARAINNNNGEPMKVGADTGYPVNATFVRINHPEHVSQCLSDHITLKPLRYELKRVEKDTLGMEHVYDALTHPHKRIRVQN